MIDPLLIGLSTPCGTITATDAAVMNKIWQGPVTTDGRSLWYGLVRGASPAAIAGTTTTNGSTTPAPEQHAVGWLGTWLQQNPSWDWKTLTFPQFDALFEQSGQHQPGTELHLRFGPPLTEQETSATASSVP
jgi:hypothetical protein